MKPQWSRRVAAALALGAFASACGDEGAPDQRVAPAGQAQPPQRARQPVAPPAPSQPAQPPAKGLVRTHRPPVMVGGYQPIRVRLD